MVCDVLRSCYEAPVQFYTNPGSPLNAVRWFFTPPGTPVYPGPSIFTSPVWFANSGIPELPIGEFSERLVAWQNGLPPPVTFTYRPIGNAADFVNGVAAPPNPPLPCAVEGVPTAVVIP